MATKRKSTQTTARPAAQETTPIEEVVNEQVEEDVQEDETPATEEEQPQAEAVQAEDTPAEVTQPPVVSVEQGVQTTNHSVEVKEDEANYLNLPKEIRDAQASVDIVDTNTNTKLKPPMNPFMMMEEQRKKQEVTSRVPNLDDMTKLLIEKNIAVDKDYTLSSINSTLANYVENMAPNVPKSADQGARFQSNLASAFFSALSAAPDVSLEALRLIEVYFATFNTHALSRTHVFRFMDVVRLSANHLRAFQSLLHLFVELGSPDGRTHKEVAREVNLSLIADALVDNTDAQARLVEFMAN